MRLLDGGADEVESVGDPPGVGDLGSTPFRGAPVEGFVGVNQMVERTDDFVNGRIAVGAVGVDDVDVGEAKALKREVQAFDDVFAGEADIVDGVGGIGGVVETEVNLCDLVLLCITCLAKLRLTFVETTRSFCFQPNFLMAEPRTISALPAL